MPFLFVGKIKNTKLDRNAIPSGRLVIGEELIGVVTGVGEEAPLKPNIAERHGED